MLKRDATLIFSIFSLSWPILWAILRLAYDYFPQSLNKTCFSTSGTVSPPTSQAAALCLIPKLLCMNLFGYPFHFRPPSPAFLKTLAPFFCQLSSVFYG